MKKSCWFVIKAGHKKCSVQQSIQDNAGRFKLGGHAIGRFYLAENLRFADHHRIQTRGHAEHMTHCIIAFMDVKGVIKLIKWNFVKFGDEVFRGRYGARFIIGHHQQFNPVAGRQQDGFLRMAKEVVVKWDGFVVQFAGDEIMALFNVPLRRDDYRRRAVAAASDIQKSLYSSDVA